MRFFLALGALVLAAPLAAQRPSPPSRPLPAAEQAAIFQAAGAVRRGRSSVICTEDRGAATRRGAVRDLNGDGRPEAIVSEDGLFCHGNTGTGFCFSVLRWNGRAYVPHRKE